MLRILSNSLRVARLPTLVLLFASLVGSGVSVLAPILTGQAIGGAPDAVRSGLTAGYVAILVLLVVLLLVGNLAGVVGDVSRPDCRGAVDGDVLSRVGWAMSDDPDLGPLHDPKVADRVQLIRSRYWEAGMGQNLLVSQFIPNVLTLLGTSIALAVVLTWWAPLPLLIMVALSAERIRRVIVAQFDIWTGQTEEQKHAYYAFGQGMGKAAKEIRIFGLTGYLRDRMRDYSLAALKPYWAERNHHTWQNLLIYVSRALVTVGLLAFVGWQAANGRFDLTTIATSVPLILTIANTDVWMIAMLQRSTITLRWLDELAPPQAYEQSMAGARAEPAVPRVTTSPVGQEPPAIVADHQISAYRQPPEIVFDEVSFGYPTSDQLILDNLTLELPAGEAVALVGVNGAGKSTLVKLLAAGYLPSRGKILVDGIDLADLDVDERRRWQRRVAPITQEFLRLPLPAGDNVEMGAGSVWSGRVDHTDDAPDATDLDAMAERAGIGELIARLPAGWATPLDKTMPGGTDLSGGEWQRIGLARALRAVSAGAQMLVLDEPAAALDVESEARLVGGYLELARSVTSLIISHRFSVVRPVPLICVLEHGRIVERGPHEALMAIPGGRYRTLFTLQANRYLRDQHGNDHAVQEEPA